MGNTPVNNGIDFSDLGGKPISPITTPAAAPASSSGIDFSDLGGKPISPLGTQTTETQALPSTQQTTQMPAGAGPGGLATRRNAMAQPGVTPTTRQNPNPVTGQPQNLLGIAWLGRIAQKIQELQDLTQDEKIQHPVKAAVGEGINRLEDLLVGNPSHGGMQTGFLTNPVTSMLIPGAEGESLAAQGTEASGRATEEAVASARNAAGQAKQAVSPITEGGAAEEVSAGRTATTPKEAAVAKATSKSGISPGTPETVPPTGENIQPNLHQGIRDFVNKTNAENGLPPVSDKVNVLDAAQNQADAFQTRSQATFDKVKEITGVDPTALKKILASRTDQIESLFAAGKDEEAGNLQQLQLKDQDRMTKAFNDAKAKDVDVEQARDDWNKSLRADELSNAIRGSKSNLSTLASPDIDPSKLTSRLQKLYESQPGGKTAKLAQLGGDQNATTLVEHAENARDAARTIKEFVPQSATGQQALAKIISDNTIEKSSLIRGGKAVGRTDWNGVVKDIGNLTPEQQKAFGGELAQVRQYAGKQALRQNAISLLKKGGAIAAGGGLAGLGYEGVTH